MQGRYVFDLADVIDICKVPLRDADGLKPRGVVLQVKRG